MISSDQADAPKVVEQNRNDPPKGAVEPMGKPLAGCVDNSTEDAHQQQVPVPSPSQVRVMVYVDGFNLYHGMRQKYGKKYHWLDLKRLAQSLLKPGQVLVGVKYFSANVRNDPAGAARQQVYLNALHARGVEVILGRFQEKQMHCNACGAEWRSYEEKESDVNFCINLQRDASRQVFDTAILLTGDSDMVAAVKLVKSDFPQVRMVAAFPPKRFSADLGSACGRSFHINESTLRGAQFPASFSHEGSTLARPIGWS